MHLVKHWNLLFSILKLLMVSYSIRSSTNLFSVYMKLSLFRFSWPSNNKIRSYSKPLFNPHLKNLYDNQMILFIYSFFLSFLTSFENFIICPKKYPTSLDELQVATIKNKYILLSTHFTTYSYNKNVEKNVWKKVHQKLVLFVLLGCPLSIIWW